MTALTTRLRSAAAIQLLVVFFLIPGLAFFPSFSYANPSGGSVVHGGVTIGDGLNGHLSIHQATDKAIINWAEFSIAAGETTEFIQPGTSSAVLNRVVSGNPTSIHGALKANGKVFVINPNGILVGPSGQIDVGGLVLSTLDVSNQDFLAGGDMLFTGTSQAGVKNMGRINAIGGDVFLIGKTVENTGTIEAANGTVGLAAGSEVLITANPDANGERVFIKAGGSGHTIDNSGSISAAAVELKAHGNAYALAINNSGSIRATGVSNSGGRVFLRAGQGMIQNTGTIEATMPNGDGGRILIEAAKARLGGTIDASGVGGGDGGTIEIYGEDIEVTGNVLADGADGGVITVAGMGGNGPASSVIVGNGAVMSANGTSGVGGEVSISGHSVTTGIGSLISATGATDGGSVRVTGLNSASINGTIDVSGAAGLGGSAIVEGANVSLGTNSVIDASGAIGGGSVNAGGGLQGLDDSILNALTTTVAEGALINADAINSGDAGFVIVWADNDTVYDGEISAQALGASGNGGFVEVSGKDNLWFDGTVSTLAANGFNGTLLLDPSNISIRNGATNANNIDANVIEAALAGNNVVISTQSGQGQAGWIDVREDVNWNSGNSLTLLAEENIYFFRDVRNDGTGNVNVIAGWDSTAHPFATFGTGAAHVRPMNSVIPAGDVNMANVFGFTGIYGNNGGSVFVGQRQNGASSNQGVEVGSLHGQTNVAAFDVHLLADSAADNRYAQIGRYTTTNATGAITVEAKGDINIDAGDNQNRAHGQIGHGGWRRHGDKSGDITVRARGNLNATGGTGGADWGRNYAQIGHGGPEAEGNHSGTILVEIDGNILLQAGTRDRNYAQIGHNSLNRTFSNTGNISVTAGGTIDLLSQAGAHNHRYAMIGHGGSQDTGVKNGNIDVQSGDTITLRTGDRYGSSAQIGHGGTVANGDILNSTVTVNSGGAIVIDASIAGVSERYYAMIGHGGTELVGNKSGAIDVDAVGGITMLSGDRYGSFTQIGHGGTRASGNVLNSDIDVNAGGQSRQPGARLITIGEGLTPRLVMEVLKTEGTGLEVSM